MAQRAYEKGLEFVEQQILHSTDPQEKKDTQLLARLADSHSWTWGLKWVCLLKVLKEHHETEHLDRFKKGSLEV